MIFRSLVYGIVAHLLLGWALLFLQRPEQPKPRLPPVKVEVRVTAKPEVTPIPRDRKAPAPGVQRPQAAKDSQPNPPGAPAAQAYSDLIPKAATGQITLPTDAPSSPGLIPTQQFKENTSGTTRQKLMIDASSLSAAFDIPLRVRRETPGVEAFLRLERDAARRLQIVDLRGDPLLRSVMYESLHTRRVQKMVQELMDALEENTLPITLRALMGDAERMQDESDVSWIGRRLIIRKSAPPQSRPAGGGIALPDEDAKKAIIRDRLEFERYQRSPAYRSAIQNYVIPDIGE